MRLEDLQVKIFCDSGDVKAMAEMRDAGIVRGFTSNPSLCRKAGVSDYLSFCREASTVCGDLPLSLEVVADEPSEMMRQAKILAAIGPNVCVKIPIVGIDGSSRAVVIRQLASEEITVNATAVFTVAQIDEAANALWEGGTGYVSVFAGRIADAGLNPLPTIRHAVDVLEDSDIQVLWASVREPFNVAQANVMGCDAITVFPEMLRKLRLFGKDLTEFSVETSRMFFDDGKAAGYVL